MVRSNWKGPYLDVGLKTQKYSNKILVSRNSKIIPKFLGLTINTHNGKNYQEILITEDMLGHKIGEFFFTRKKFSFKKKKSKK